MDLQQLEQPIVPHRVNKVEHKMENNQIVDEDDGDDE